MIQKVVRMRAKCYDIYIMITPEEIEKMAELSRIKITDEEKAQFSKEIDAILAYVADINKAAVEVARGGSGAPEPGAVRNVLRDDSATHEPRAHTGAILAEAPARDGDYIKVKKIL
jgi:aspartyl-tRNA(Asn)/glutamyl-tRNA(Gln) amidotransferase subunit C